MYAYTLNNPVMGIDPEGEFVISALIIGFAVGATIGAISGGVKAYNNGDNVVGGAISGGLIGGAIGLAGAAGVVYLGPLIAGTAATGAGTNALVALGATTAFSFAAGAGGYVIDEKLNDREVNLGNAIGQGTMVALQSVWTFGVGGAVGSIGTTGTTGRLLSKEWLGKLTFTQEFTQPFKYPIDIIRNECFI